MRSVPHRFVPLWATLFAISFAMNCLAHRPTPVRLSSEAVNVSIALQHGRGFSDPFATGPSGPTAHIAPLYPMLHAAVCLIFGAGFAGFYAILAVTCLAWSLQCVLMQRFASLHGRPRAGTIAAFFLALPPLHAVIFNWEAAFAAAAIVGCACLISVILAGRSSATSHALLGGIMAICTLFNPATILIWTAWAVLVMFKLGMRRLAKILLPAALVFVIPVGAWTARNYLVFHHLFFVRDNMGLELAASYNDCALSVMAPTSSTCYTPFHPNSDAAVERVLAAMGEFQFNVMCRAEAYAWIRAHPVQSIEITAWHFFYFWFPIERAGLEALLYGIGISIVTLLSLPGISWRRNEGFQIAVIAMLSYSTIYAVFRAVPRFRYPVLWVTVLLMVVGIETWIARRKAR